MTSANEAGTVHTVFCQATWRTSSYSSPNGGNCIEMAVVGDRVAVRDSKDRSGPVLVVTRAEWRAFLAGARDGQLG